MSLLAVRYVPQPFQTFRDILDHPSVAIIMQKQSSYEQTLRVTYEIQSSHKQKTIHTFQTLLSSKDLSKQ